MHRAVMESLEEFLAGTLEPAERRAIEAHLGGCGECREELRQMEEVSRCFGSLQSAEELAPAPGFYGRVAQRVNDLAPRPSWSNLFALSPAFGRRLVFASTLLLAALGTYLFSTERQYTAEPMPDAVMAEQSAPQFDSAPASDKMLVTLAHYEH